MGILFFQFHQFNTQQVQPRARTSLKRKPRQQYHAACFQRFSGRPGTVWDSSREDEFMFSPGKAAQWPFLLLCMKWAMSGMKSLTTGVEIHSDINIFAVSQLEEGCGKIYHNLLLAKPAFIKKWSFRPHCYQGAWGSIPTSSYKTCEKELGKREHLSQATLRKRTQEKKNYRL